jgi:hypothetical protein
MTTFIARSGDRATDSGTAFRAGQQRFTCAVVSLSALVLDAVEATRAIGSTHGTVGRRAVLERFAADTTRDAGRSAA